VVRGRHSRTFIAQWGDRPQLSLSRFTCRIRGDRGGSIRFCAGLTSLTSPPLFLPLCCWSVPSFPLFVLFSRRTALDKPWSLGQCFGFLSFWLLSFIWVVFPLILPWGFWCFATFSAVGRLFFLQTLLLGLLPTNKI